MQVSKKMLMLSAWIILLSFVALTVATFAWMSIATVYKVSDIDLNIISENALEIAVDNNGVPGEWGKLIPSEAIIDSNATLRPVTWSAAEKAFYAPTYGLDGRILGYDSLLVTASGSDTPTPFANEAEEEKGAGYLIAVDLWMRTGAKKITTYLSEPEITEGGGMMGDGTFVIGAPEWSTEGGIGHHVSAGNGAESVIRIGFLTYDYYSADGQLYQESTFYIYEPNTTADEETLGVDGQPLHTGGKLIKQSVSGFSDLDQPLNGTVNYQMGEFISEDTEMFDLLADIPRKVTMFIWLEGQDGQCENAISAGKIFANLQFAATTKNNQQGIGRPEGGGES